jgi:hypothetical protein
MFLCPNNMFLHYSHTGSHLVPDWTVIRYSHSMSSGTHTPVIWYSHSMSSGTHNSAHLVPKCSRNHLVPECSRSSGTNINNHPVLDYSRKFGMLLEENQDMGFVQNDVDMQNMCQNSPISHM